MKKLLKYLSAAILVLAVIFSCNKNNQTQSDPLSGINDENHLIIEANDNMQFNTTELKAKAGKPITLMLRHTGKMDKGIMGHNWILLKPGVNMDDFSKKAEEDKDHDYIPQSELSDIIVHTKLVGGGESDAVTFTINEKGSYDFLCSFPTHHAIMRGKLIIE